MVKRTRRARPTNSSLNRSSCEVIRIQPKRRCRRVGSCANILTLLDPDALLQVFLRTDCHDHAALWRTCREFRAILDSPVFAQQRAITEWAQVEARPWMAQEIFTHDHDFEDGNDESSAMAFVQAMMQGRYSPMGCVEVPGAIRNYFSIYADKVVVGRGSYVVVDRLSRRSSSFHNFHSTCDHVSQDLQQVACLFFNRDGGLRLREVREAVDSSVPRNRAEGEASTGDYASRLLYIASLKLHPFYRGRKYTWIGANALRSLMASPVLNRQWDISVYVGDPHAQFTASDVERQCAMKERSIAQLLGMQPAHWTQAKANWQGHLDLLAQDDLRPFLRAGFQQTAETVLCTARFHVFCLPQFLETKPLLSGEETERLRTIHKGQFSLGSAPVREPDCALLQYIVAACARRKQLMRHLEALEESVPTSADQVRLSLDQGFQQMVVEHVTSVAQTLDASLKEHDEYCKMLRMNLEYMQQELLTTQRVLLNLQAPTGPYFSHEVSRIRNNLASLQRNAQELEEQVKTKELVVAQARRRRNAINVEDLLVAAWNEYRSQRDSMADRMLLAARENVKKARDDVIKHDSDVQEEVDQQVRKSSASVCASNALHACAANMLPEYIDLVWKFVPENKLAQRAALSKRDEHGATPLMAVVGTDGSDCEKVEQLRYKTAEKLVDLGIDKNITNGWGETALGVHRKNKRSRDDFHHAYNLFPESNSAIERIHTRLEQLLRPFGGPTAADDAILDSFDVDGDHEGDSDEDDEGDENDIFGFVLLP